MYLSNLVVVIWITWAMNKPHQSTDITLPNSERVFLCFHDGKYSLSLSGK